MIFTILQARFHLRAGTGCGQSPQNTDIKSIHHQPGHMAFEETGHNQPDPLGDRVVPQDMSDHFVPCASVSGTPDRHVQVPLELKHPDWKTLMGGLPHGVFVVIHKTRSRNVPPNFFFFGGTCRDRASTKDAHLPQHLPGMQVYQDPQQPTTNNHPVGG